VVSGADADTFVFVDRGMEEGPGREGSGLELVRSTISDPHLSSRAMIVPFGEAHGCACCWGLIAGFRDSRGILLRESGFTVDKKTFAGKDGQTLRILHKSFSRTRSC
jgi:hypothetical protein